MTTVLDEVRARIPGCVGESCGRWCAFARCAFPRSRPTSTSRSPARDDYFRHATLGLAVQRVLDEGVPGASAEVGVWPGETSAFLHWVAPDRRLYLFETFTGLPDGDLPPGLVDVRFRDTSEEAVRRRLGGASNVVLRAGPFPGHAGGLEGERFAFVLIDLDLLEPTRASLDFLYPRLSPGGYLVVHDYNNPESDWACKRALDAFLEDRPERLVEVGDVRGSARNRRVG